MEDGSWKREGPREMMVPLDSARQWYPREIFLACNADHTQIAKLKRGEAGIYPVVISAIKQAMLSAGDLGGEGKSTSNEAMRPRASRGTHLADSQHQDSYLVGFTPPETIFSQPTIRSSRDAAGKDRRAYTLDKRNDFHEEHEGLMHHNRLILPS